VFGYQFIPQDCPKSIAVSLRSLLTREPEHLAVSASVYRERPQYAGMSANPPGPKGVPLLGNTGQYARDPFRFMTAVGEAYGDVARLELAGVPTFMLTNPADIETVLVGDGDAYVKPEFGGDDAVENLLGNGLLTSEGEFWRDQRRLAGRAFDPNRISNLAGMMVAHTESMVERWEPGEPIDVRTELAKVTVRIIVNAMFGTDIDRGTTERVQAALEPLGERFEPDPLRFLTPNWLPTAENRSFAEAVRTLEGVLDDVVAERRAAGYAGGDDLLSVLLRAQDRGEQADSTLRDEMMTMLLAGHDTTALTLTYTYYLLGRHPEAKARLHEEVDAVDGRPTAADAMGFEYTSNVLNEAMRLYPPVYVLFRSPTRDVEFGGYHVPEGAFLMLPQWVVHRSERYWEDPLAFDPNRWDRTDHHRFAFFPFGGGKRICIGKQFSLLESKLILATVARHYDLELVDDGELTLQPTLTMHPADPVEVVPRLR
jgi:cytochrome P450